MKKRTTVLGYILLFFFLLTHLRVPAQVNSSLEKLKFRDRVVFLGNSLFENDVPFGYLEYAITSQLPEKEITFRNIGWSGDNVQGAARSYITNPPTSYDLLISQIKDSKPNLVFLGYGGIESEEGTEGLAKFNKGYNHLIDVIEQLGADVVILSTLPILSGPAEQVAARNQNLELYNKELVKIAQARKKEYLNLYHPIAEFSKNHQLTDNGYHLNETGYYYLATAFEKALGFASRKEDIALIATKTGIQSSNKRVQETSLVAPNSYQFTVKQNAIPLPAPTVATNEVDQFQTLKVDGLKKGFYTLKIDDDVIATASASEWAKGVAIKNGPDYNQANVIRTMIAKKSDLFFQQYRPLNRTYIIGFRLYEQGRHKQGLEDLNFIMTWLEGQIAVEKAPKKRVYQLTLLK